MSDGKVVFDITGTTTGIDQALKTATDSISKQTAKWTVLAQTAMNGLTNVVSSAFRGIAALAQNSFDYNASMEMYLINFSTLLGDMSAAAETIQDLQTYANETPFSMSDLANATQTMLAYGIAAEDTSKALKLLGDISLGDANKLKTLVLAFSQVASTGKLMGNDLLQMVSAGFNPLTVLAEATGLNYQDLRNFASYGDFNKVSGAFINALEQAVNNVARLGDAASETDKLLASMYDAGVITSEHIMIAMELATSETGRFHNALQKASLTATGQLATISDGWDMLIGKIGKGGFDYLSAKLFPKLIDWLDKLNAAVDENGIRGMADALPGILAEAKVELVNVVSAVVAAIYNAFTGKDIDQAAVKAAIHDALSSIGETLAAVGTFFTVDLPATWEKVQAIVDKVTSFLGIETGKAAIPDHVGTATIDLTGAGYTGAAAQGSTTATDSSGSSAGWGSSGFQGFADWSMDDISAAIDYIKAFAQVQQGNAEYLNMQNNAMQRILQGQRQDANSFATAVDELFASLEEGDPVQIPAEWMEGTDAELQAALNGMDLSVDVSVNPVYSGGGLSGIGGSIADLFSSIAGWFGQDHAAGGIFSGSTRLLGRDGSLHTVGESSAEAILPLDTLWRRLGLMMDGAFAENLGDLQYRVMPAIPASAPASGMDEATLGGVISERVEEAIRHLVIEMNHQVVAKVLTPSVSRNVSDEIKRRKWTG